MRALLIVAVLGTGCRAQRPVPVVYMPDEQPAGSDAPPPDAAPPPATDAAVGPPPSSEPPKPASLERDLAAVRDRLGLPAIGAAAWRSGALVEQAVVGVRKQGDTAKVTADDRWHLGSNTKAMTATLVAMYVDRGTLRWTDTIGSVLGGKGAKVHGGYKNITLDQLLRHTGGAPATPPPAVWAKLWSDGAAPDARTTFVRSIISAKPETKAGEYVYSNAGYIIAGAMLEAKTGKTWEQLVRADLFDKLGMASCGFGPPGNPGKVDQPRGHDASGASIEPGPKADNPPGLGPAGTVHCSLADYGKFLMMIAGGSPALLKPATLKRLQTVDATSQYAGGWIVATSGGDTVLAHSGSNTMWYATAVVVPKQSLAFVVVTNKADDRLEDIIPTLLERYVP